MSWIKQRAECEHAQFAVLTILMRVLVNVHSSQTPETKQYVEILSVHLRPRTIIRDR